MKKLIVVSVIMALMLLAWSVFAPSHAQDSANEEKPTFYRLTPGVYVNGWPRFTVSYPKDWVEKRPRPEELFTAKAPGPAPYPSLSVVLNSNPPPLDKFADLALSFLRAIAKDASVVVNKPSQLRDGTPAQENEFQMVLNGVPGNVFQILTKKGDVMVFAAVWSLSRTIEEDLKAIAYSLEFQPGKDEPVKVPPDVQEFLDKNDSDLVSHDLAKVMTHYSDRYLNSGMRKLEVERNWRQWIGFIISIKGVITDFVPAGDRAYLAGFTISNLGKIPISASIIKENGEWKWRGNQRDPSP